MNFFKKELDKYEFQFLPRDEEAEKLVPSPKPARNYFPQWLKEMPNSFKDEQGYEVFGSATRCMPFVDSFTSGYIQELACDVTVRHEGKTKDGTDIIRYRWAGLVRPLSTRAEQFKAPNLFPKFDGFYHTEMHWFSFWEPKTPKGYSSHYHHPSNRFDLPFQTMSGVIDTDSWPMTGPVPFLIKEGFTGVIPAGTPIYQITFVKRNDWNSSEAKYDPNYQLPLRQSVRKYSKDGYKKEIWTKKKFN